MSESMTSDALTTEDALLLVREARTYEEPLRRRTEGVTWMVWGIVSAAIFLSYDASSALYRSFDEATGVETIPPWWLQILWVYWVLIGVATTYAVWRIAGATVRLPARTPRGLWFVVPWLAALFAGWALFLWAIPGHHVHLTPLLGIATAWTLLGATNVHRATAQGRVVTLAIGVSMLVAAIAAALVIDPGWHDVALRQANGVRVLMAGLLPFVGGLWQVLRG